MCFLDNGKEIAEVKIPLEVKKLFNKETVAEKTLAQLETLKKRSG